MTDPVTIVLDDSLFSADCSEFLNLTSIGGPSLYPGFSTFNGTFMVSDSTCHLSRNLNRGTSISFYGFTPPAEANQTFTVSLSSSGSQDEQVSYPQPAVGDLWYTSAVTSPDSVLTDWIDIQFGGPNLIFDYALATVAELTELRGETILVDDSNSEIQWLGNWQEKTNYTLQNLNIPNVGPPTSHRGALSRPHGNGTHDSNSVGDMFIFQFQGTSITVSGVAPLGQEANDASGNVTGGDFHLSLNFTLDGISTSVVLTNGHPDVALAGSPHFSYFSHDPLDGGNHTLIMTVDIAINTSVTIDYLTYQPSFSSLLEKPNFPPINATSSTSTPSPTPSTIDQPVPASVKKSHTSAIAGGVVGGVAFVVLLSLGIWLLYRKNQQSKVSSLPTNKMEQYPNLAVEPFVLPSTVESGITRKGGTNTPSNSNYKFYAKAETFTPD
ncbi:hypothetical protein K435DRAFT_841575 [Dendrothele bispora CBS 962.96]|uniref:Uncharacterized protein n=1 Tax=Dendrothele bispora (strain CBS 962.96) TaxID=1314807 RepID=A0A4S8LLJ3_DENBC|nr:hypothetical protein K435DRAFT_841575 [Dendrothele bispora CBS 962.96]